jgi:VanZ family protein
MIEPSYSRPWYDTPLARWLAVALWMGVIFVLSSQPNLPKAPGPWLEWLVKKGAHFSVYALLALLLWRAFDWRERLWRWAWLVAVVYAISDEWHQSFVSNRHPQATDVLIDACGAATALLIAWLLSRNASNSKRAGRMLAALSKGHTKNKVSR